MCPPPDNDVAIVGETSLSRTTIEDEAARLKQALSDLSLSEATGLSLVHCPSQTAQAALLRRLTEVAHDARYVVCPLSLAESPVDAISALVSAMLDALCSKKDPRLKGLLGLLALFEAKWGSNAAMRLSERFEEREIDSDLAAFCLAYLQADDSAEVPVRDFAAWAEGEVRARFQSYGVRGVLDDKSAQRVFADLSQIVLALGYQGLVVVLRDGEAIATRTERQRERAYTVLRELVDNFDSGQGCVATKLIVTGGDALFLGENSLQSLQALWTRLEIPSDAEPPPPHRSWTSLIKEPYDYIHRAIRPSEQVKPARLRMLIRASQGLPPTEAVTSMSVGHEKIDKTISKLFSFAEMAGSVFQVVVGEYGSGKTHLMLHLAERATQAGHPVFWLNLERMNLDLGNPQRHLQRLLTQSTLPKKSRPSALSRARFWTKSKPKLNRLRAALEELEAAGGLEAHAAKKALAFFELEEGAGAAIEAFLTGEDLKEKPASSNYRQDAYRRLLLFCELLQRLEGCKGPVLLIDEAENLYTSGVSRNARRSALRTLSFYCGGAIPGACVILAMTPNVLSEMRKESRELLGELGEVDSTLDVEDAELFRRRLRKLEPDEVPLFSRKMRRELAQKVRQTHQSVRGPVEVEDWEARVKELSQSDASPRKMVRSLVDRLEAAWWWGRADV